VVYIANNEESPTRSRRLSSINIKLNNISLTLEGDVVKLMTKGEVSMPMTELLGLLHDLVEEFKKDGE
tara:strand:- start:431 stop:634 length:204 start_codon:yes stop_codon:yes gene_type:complete